VPSSPPMPWGQKQLCLQDSLPASRASSDTPRTFLPCAGSHLLVSVLSSRLARIFFPELTTDRSFSGILFDQRPRINIQRSFPLRSAFFLVCPIQRALSLTCLCFIVIHANPLSSPFHPSQSFTLSILLFFFAAPVTSSLCGFQTIRLQARFQLPLTLQSVPLLRKLFFPPTWRFHPVASDF